MAGEFQDFCVADDVGTGVGVGIRHGVANAGLRSQMENDIEALRAGRGRERARLGDVRLDELEIRARSDLREPPLFQGGIVVGIELVYGRDGMAGRQERQGRVEPDEARASRDQNTHSPVLEQSQCGRSHLCMPIRCALKPGARWLPPSTSAKRYFPSPAWARDSFRPPRRCPKRCCRWWTSRSSNTPSRKPRKRESNSSFS